jgi:iron complex outermembrane receptor protein
MGLLVPMKWIFAPEQFFKGGRYVKAIPKCLQALSATLFASLAIAQSAPPAREMMIDIKPQPIVEALNDWAQQTGFQLIVPEEATDSALRSRAVLGRYTAQAALEELLIGMPLTYTFVNARTVAINGVAKLATRPQLDRNQLRKSHSDVLVASLNEVIVTGSRLRFPREDIRADGSVDTPAPVAVFNRDRIDQTGASTVPELLKYVPQQPFKRFEGGTFSGAQPAELRGVGVDATLVLINGRRTLPSANTIESNNFDLNTIPLAAVDRVEILSDSASAVYGADAVGGVINLILKKEMARPTLDLQYGGAEGGAEERRISLGAGFSTDRFHSLVVLDYFDRGLLMGSDRKRWKDANYERFGSADGRSTAVNPGNIRSVDGSNLPGLPSPFAAVPAGSRGLLTPSQLLATAGQENRASQLQYSTIIPEADRRSVAAFADFDITPTLNVFAELLYAKRRSNFKYEPLALRDMPVPATNPYNPFGGIGTTVLVDYLLVGLGQPRTKTQAELVRGLAGLRGAVGAWDWELSALNTNEENLLSVENEADFLKVFAALGETDPARALNVFQEGPAASADVLAQLLAPTRTYKAVSSGMQTAAVIRGPLFTAPAGPVEMVLGGEWFDSEIDFESQVNQVDHGRTASAAFAEVRVPIVSAAMRIPAVHTLSLTTAVRNDHYGDFGDTFNPQYGLVWRPIADLMLRASYGTAFRAPSLFELYAPRQEFPGISIPDPVRNDPAAPTKFITGGNPNLEPTEADSFTAGFVLTPKAIPGLTFSSTYWRIELESSIRVLPFNTILANEQMFADRIVRAAPDAVDIALGRPGRLQSLDISRVNFGSIDTSGIDTSAGYSFDTPIGRFAPSLTTTWIADYETVELPGTRPEDKVGVANATGTILKWRTTATLGWSLRGISLAATGRYTPGYDDARNFTGPNGKRVSSQTLLDLQGSVDFDNFFSERSTWMSGLKLTAGVTNALNAEPRFSEITQGQGFDPSQGDLRQRFAYLRLSASF